jgi:hypothetical protein
VTRPSPARPDNAGRRSRATAPIPSTVWLCPTAGAGLDIEPPLAAVVTATVTSFSAPGHRVGILAWPTPTDRAGGRPAPLPCETAPTSVAPADTTTDALDPRWAPALIAGHGRIPVVLDLAPAGPADGLPLGADSPSSLGQRPPSPSPTAAGSHRLGDGSMTPLELIITAVAPDAVDDATAARVTLAAARGLRRGGILAVLTHGDVREGVLVDPGGVLVTAGQNADLLYLQHIVAVHAPIRDGHICPDPTTPAPDPTLDGAAGGWPAPHRRVHADVYVLAQQRDHHDTEPVAAAADPTSGAHR